MSRKSKLTPFPNDFDSPSQKAGKKWGLRAAQAIFSNSEHYGPSLFYNDREFYRKLIQYALGEQDQAQYKPVLGINPKDAKKTWVKAIRYQIKNYATKRINVAVSKQTNRKYDAVFSAIDPLSLNAKADYEARLDAYINNSEWLNQVGADVGANLAPGGMSLDKVPKNAEERDLHMQMDYKLRDEIEMELGVELHLTRNDWEEIERQTSVDTTIFGVKAIEVGIDESTGMPFAKRRNPAKVIVPHSETPDFERIKYWAYMDDYTVSELKTMVNGEIDSETLEDIVEEFATKQPEDHYYNYESLSDSQRRDVDKIKVMKFEIRTTNELVHMERQDEFGNTRFLRKEHGYYSGKKGLEKFAMKFGNSRKLHRTPYDAIYTGYWIVGSEAVFGYKLKPNVEQGSRPGKCSMGMKIYAPNMIDGKITSIGKQMIPILDDLQTYNLKIQHVIARAIPKGMGIDLYALRKAQLKWDGKNMSDQEKIEMFFQSGIFVFDSSDRYKPGSNYKPFIEAENGMAADITHYLSLIQQSLFELEEVTGINKVAAASTLSSDTLVGTAEVQQASSETAFDYLHHAKKKTFIDVARSLAKLHVMSVRNHPGKYDGIIGQDSIDFINSELGPFQKDYGIYAEAKPTQEEWAELYRDLEQARADGFITSSDKFMIRRIKNLKQAYMYMKVIEQRRQEAVQEANMANIQANEESNSRSQQQAHEFKMKELQEQHRLNMLEKRADADNFATQSDLKRGEIRLAELLRGDSKSRHIEEQGDEVLDQIRLKAGLEPKVQKTGVKS